MNDRQKKQNLRLEKTQAVERRRLNRRVKQFFMLALFSLPIILYLSSVLTTAGVNDVWSVVIFCAILIALWFLMILCDNLVLKRAKKIRQIKNAQAIVDKYNAEVLRKREEENAAKQREDVEEVNNSEIESEQQDVVADAEPENKNELADKIDLQNQAENVIINNEEKKNKLKQKKYGGFNNKRKK